jgi:hypothetical protein
MPSRQEIIRARNQAWMLIKKRRLRAGGGVNIVAEIGDVGTTTLEVLFDEAVQSADFTAGVTIRINTVEQTILSGTLQGDDRTVYYVIDTPADINDEITWEYSAASGDIQDAAGNALRDVSTQTATNYIGSQLYFQDFNSSGHFAHL